MRNLFLALLLANLLFLAWQVWIVPPETDATRLRSPGPEAQVLLARSPQAPGSASGADSCLRLGPIGEGQVADALRARLAGHRIESSMTTDEGQVWVGHWVQIEGFATRAAADQAVARLAAGELPDAYVLQATAPFSVSLGVFRDRARADAVAAAAAKLGFSPTVTDRYRVGLQYWLTFASPEDGGLAVEELVGESGQILRTEEVACPARTTTVSE